MEHYNDLGELAKGLRDKLSKDKKKDIILLYAYNGVGKTRLSMEFKELGREDDKRDTLYFNAFTEDLFYWDNDLEEDTTRVLNMNLKSSFFGGAKEYALEDKIRVFWRSFSDIDFQIDYEKGSISFSTNVFSPKEGDAPCQGTVNNIKISRGEETIFVWCFFLTIVQLVLDGDEGYSWVKYIYIDDPISSLDDNNAVAVAVLLERLFKAQDKVKIVISTHHVLFYNALWNVFNSKKKMLSIHLKHDGSGGYDVDATTKDTPRFLHVAMLEDLWNRVESGALYTYHFGMLRNVLERAASFHGHEKFEECFKNEDIQEESPLYSRIINILTHGNYSLYEPVEMMEDNKQLFRKILSAFTKNYKFNPSLFNQEEV